MMMPNCVTPIEIGKVIDEVLPKLGQHKLAHSIVVKAMILNCLGFTDSRLYMYSGSVAKNHDIEAKI